MGLVLKTEGDPVIPVGDYEAVVSRYQGNIPGKYGTLIRVFCRILSGQFAGVEVSRQFSQAISPRTDLYSFLRIVDVAIPEKVGEDVHLDTMMNRALVITVEPNVTERGTYNNITKWRRSASGLPQGSIVTPVPAAVPGNPGIPNI